MKKSKTKHIRESLDLTDAELYIICRAIDSHVNSRDVYFSKGSAKVCNNLIRKLIANGLKRKNSEKILQPIYIPADKCPMCNTPHYNRHYNGCCSYMCQIEYERKKEE